MEISVVIPTYNRLSSLKRMLEALERQTLATNAFEVVVVSDGSTDGTVEYLQGWKTCLKLKAIQQANAGPAGARNRGIEEAQGRIIVFLDDDVVPIPDLLSEHLKIFQEQGENIVVLGPMLSPLDFRLSPWVAWEQRMLVKQYQAMMRKDWEPTGRQFYTGNSSVSRQWLLKSGGFDPAFKRAEDVELAYRLADLGLKFIYNPCAVGYHYAVRSFASWNATPYAYGRNDVIFSLDKGQSWILPTMREEYQQRNPLVRGLVYTCLNRPAASRMVRESLRWAALASSKLGLTHVSDMALSGIFNLSYYQGVADQMGGRRKFIDWMARV